MICSGVDVETGQPIEVEYERTIRAVRPGSVTDRYICPSFIDIQVNGFAGVDYNSPATPASEILRSIEVIRSTGVARFLPTVITGGPDDMLGALRNLARITSSAIEGFHVEGPHLSPEEGPRGAHPLRWIRVPDIAEYRRWQDATDGRVRIVTVSPHWDNATAYIEALASDGVTVSIGHTHASPDQIANAVAAGATMSTHLGNAAHAMIRKQPNYIWEQLAEDRLTASFIVDGIHIQRAFLKSCIRAKGVERSVLVTDASSPAGAKPGRYHLGEQAVDLTEDDHVVLAGTDRLAGSSLRMHHGVANLMKLAQLSLREAVRMATVNPARAANIPGRKRGLVVGERADVLVFRVENGEIQIESNSFIEP
ncbi:MAG: N-acetylglucosamine 6-phosphate deacetylase [Bryobacterales bacterium]|nr:N-acetylglucosamine 6-phosphate deacetylase [Bryobacterales bacterium]